MKLRKKRPEAEIPTASMADIAFLLIVFFMVTTVFAANMGLDFSIPPPEETEATEQEEAVHIKVDVSGQILVDDKPMQPGQILGYLRPKLQRWPDKPIIVTTDPQAPYEGFIHVYDELRRAELPEEKGGIGLKIKNVSIPSLEEIARLKAQFGEEIFQ